MNEQQRQAYLDQINYGRIERVIAYKNVQFILEHQNDTLERSRHTCRAAWRISASSAPVEVIGAGLHHISFRLMASRDPIFLCRKNHKHQKPTTFS